jgi:hypothetical protein
MWAVVGFDGRSYRHGFEDSKPATRNSETAPAKPVVPQQQAAILKIAKPDQSPIYI